MSWIELVISSVFMHMYYDIAYNTCGYAGV